jgi:UDP-N-acetylmuramyl pentapeptide phosphotransferase/UDP-N-acetylglucosamine-1-phosphate transferase
MLLTFWMHPLIVKLARQRHIVDEPDERKLQKAPIPVMGGIAVFWSLVVGTALTSLFFNSYALFPSIAAITVMLYIGALDDLISLSPTLRMIIEAMTIAFVCWMCQVNLNSFHGLFGIWNLPVWISAPLSIFCGIGIINAINMIDGVDGLSSGFCIMACIFFGIIFGLAHHGTMTVLAVLFAGSMVPFFLHNVFGKESKMFIGDAGTLMMGITMVIFVLHICDKGSLVNMRFPTIGLVAFTISVLSVPIFDTLRVMTGRIIRGISPFHADKSHLHHLFIEMGFSHLGTTISVILLNLSNILCWFVSWRLGAGAFEQFCVVVMIGVFNTTGIYYIVRCLDHRHKPYQIILKIASFTHIEDSKFFNKLSKWLDSI